MHQFHSEVAFHTNSLREGSTSPPLFISTNNGRVEKGGGDLSGSKRLLL